MSAVHGPIPCTAVSAACAASASIAASEVSASRSLATARAISLSARIFGAERPSRASFDARARMMACGSNGSNVAARRAQIAPALAVESCCDTTVAASPANPSGRRRSGGRPPCVKSAAKRASADVKAASAASRYSRVLRFAPSPNGYLHLGHAYSALLNSDMARELGGRLLLRIEDIDTERCRPEYEAAIFEDLRWLGMSWQEPVRRQSEHFADYELAIARLEADGLLYPSFESRRELATLAAELDRQGGWPRDPDGVPIYPGRARRLSTAECRRRREAGEPFALRLALDKAMARPGVLTWTETGAGPSGQTGLVTAAPQMWGDVILARKDSPASYHLAAVVDDALQGATDIVRGRDLFWSTSIHRLLQALLGLPEPSYHHHKLILDEAGQKLAKSTNATGLRELRAAGVKPFDIKRMVGLGR